MQTLLFLLILCVFYKLIKAVHNYRIELQVSKELQEYLLQHPEGVRHDQIHRKLKTDPQLLAKVMADFIERGICYAVRQGDEAVIRSTDELDVQTLHTCRFFHRNH